MKLYDTSRKVEYEIYCYLEFISIQLKSFSYTIFMKKIMKQMTFPLFETFCAKFLLCD